MNGVNVFTRLYIPEGTPGRDGARTMMAGISVNAGQARNFLIERSMLLEPAPSVEAAIDRLSCIQVDPINVVGRSHELALWNRVRRFRLAHLEDALYGRRTLFEYWQQLFSILPITSYPYMSARMGIDGGDDWHAGMRRRYAHLQEETLEVIRRRGPTSSRDLEHIEAGREKGVWSASDRARVLETLWDAGVILICGRKNNQRYYDLAERVVPPELRMPAPLDDSREFIIRQHFRYLGLARSSYLNRVGYSRELQLGSAFREVTARGEAVPVTIDGVKRTWFVHAEEADTLLRMPDAPLHGGLSILPPLDPLVIDRAQLLEVFGFEYRWEAYTPADKRKFGYYGLPLLYNGEFVGQVDARYIAEDQRVAILATHATKRGVRFERALERRTDDLARFLAARTRPSGRTKTVLTRSKQAAEE